MLCSPCKSSRPKSFQPETTVSHSPQTFYPRINQTDHVRHTDEITLDPENGIMTRSVRVKYTPQEDAYPLKPKKNKKAVVKKAIVWPDDSEAKRQGQQADCGEDLGSIELEETELMDCECRNEALHARGKDYAKKKPKTCWTDCYERDMLL